MHLCPHGVQREKIRDACRENCPAGSDYQGYMFQGTSLTWIDNFEQITDTGVFGKPTHASAEKGARFFDVITDAVERCLGAIFASWKEEHWKVPALPAGCIIGNMMFGRTWTV